jgi:TIGR03009 family protein
MKNHWKRFCRPILLGCMLGAVSFSMVNSSAWGQQAIGNQGVGPRGATTQGVAPPAAGYGNRPATTQSNSSPLQQNTNLQSNGGMQARSNQPVAQQPPSSPTAPQGNPNLNPNLNQVMNPVPAGGKVPGVGSGTEIATADPYANRPLSPQEKDYLDQVLAHWEKSTADISRYSCKFRRWQYNSGDNFVDQLAANLKVDIRTLNTTVASGEVKYMAPDRGLFKIDKLLSLTGQVVNNRPEYKEFDNRFGEWWLCDGKHVYEYDRTKKRCTKHSLPPDMQGGAILDSPMPFVFGVKAAKIKERYWARILPPPREDIVLVEVYPKYQSDAVNYDHVQIYLDRQVFLPVHLIKYNTNHVDEQGKVLKDDREIFEFTDRDKNASLLQKINENVFRQEFLPSNIPSDWEVVEVPYAPPAANDIRSAAVPPAQLGANEVPPNPPKR